MTSYHGEQKVESGIYFQVRGLCFRVVEEGERLPGSPLSSWVRVPPVALLFLGPIIGLVYVMFLPLVGIVMLGHLVITKLFGEAGQALVRVARPAWQPALAFLARNKPARKTTPPDAWSKEARAEIERREREAGDEDDVDGETR